jgi:hypothetical protein
LILTADVQIGIRAGSAMNRSNILFLALGVTSLQPLAVKAAATDPTYYLNADAGVNFENGTVHLHVGPDTLNRVSSNQHDAIWGFSVGAQFTRHFAVELGYRDLGSISGALINVPGSNPATGSFRFSARGPTAALVWRLPFGRWETDFKLGSLLANSHLSTQATDQHGTYAIHASAWNTALLAEVGIGYRLTDHWTVSLSEKSFSHIGVKYTTGRLGLRATALGVSYRF